jgi:rhamnulokinase
MLAGIGAALAQGQVATVGVDAWGVDFGLLDARGRLIANPVHYRDARTDAMVAHAEERVGREAIYAATGIQLMPINTLYQLLAMVEANDPDLARAERLLLMPDLFHHFLSGSDVGEYTNATTTQCFDVARGAWAVDLLDQLDIPTRILPSVVPPGTALGPLRADGGRQPAGDRASDARYRLSRSRDPPTSQWPDRVSELRHLVVARPGASRARGLSRRSRRQSDQ